MKKIALALVVLAVAAVAVLAYLFLKPPAAPSQPLNPAPVASATPAAPADATGQPAAPSEAPAAPTGGARVFQIDPARSEVRFTIDEVLNGAPKTVIGVSNQEGGQISIDLSDYQKTEIGEIQVNARAFATDNEFRNRAIKNRILLTDQFEFVTFKPTAVSGLPAAVELGQPFKFEISGDLTIIGQTKPVTFQAEVTAVSENEISGYASTSVLYKDFGIFIPEVPSVTGVDDDVLLEIQFTAVALP